MSRRGRPRREDGPGKYLFGRGRRLRDADHTLGDPPAGVARRLRLQVVRLGVDDEPTADDGRSPAQRDDLVSFVNGGDAVIARLDVAQVAGVAFRGVLGACMCLSLSK